MDANLEIKTKDLLDHLDVFLLKVEEKMPKLPGFAELQEKMAALREILPHQRPRKKFRVASVSSNRNDFGLRGMIVVAQDGESWQVAGNDINQKKKGEILNVPVNDRGEPDWWSFGFEVPERLKANAPPNVVKEVWGC